MMLRMPTPQHIYREPNKKYIYRDSQKQKLYDAENFLRTRSKEFKTIKQAQRFVDKLLAQKWTRKRFPKAPLSVKVVESNATSKATAYAWKNLIKLTASHDRWSWNVAVVLHEVAHILEKYRGDDVDHVKDNRSHGWKFAKTFVELVQHCMGKEHAEQLKKNFKKHGVAYTAPRNRKPLTEEQKDELRDRMAVARAARKNRWIYGVVKKGTNQYIEWGKANSEEEARKAAMSKLSGWDSTCHGWVRSLDKGWSYTRFDLLPEPQEGPRELSRLLSL